MDITILYEDADVVVIDKPVGLAVHGDGRSTRPTVADWHGARIPAVCAVGEPMVLPSGAVLPRPGVVHRLDTETSGVLVLAKNEEAFAHLKRQFHDRLAEKEYRAFAYGRLKEERGEIDRPIGRSAKDFRLRSAQRGARGVLREAVTSFRLLGASPAYSYLSLSPRTGRTHQLRVHLKAINHPIVGDRLYAPAQVARDRSALGFSRLALHAHTLTLLLPSGERATFTAPLPADFVAAEAALGEEAAA